MVDWIINNCLVCVHTAQYTIYTHCVQCITANVDVAIEKQGREKENRARTGPALARHFGLYTCYWWNYSMLKSNNNTKNLKEKSPESQCGSAVWLSAKKNR